jgi:hypothetical protein
VPSALVNITYIPTQTYAFIDCGATAKFCDFTYALSLHLLTYEIPHLLHLTVTNRQLSSASLVTHATDLLINLNRHKKIRTFYITNLSPAFLNLNFDRELLLAFFFIKPKPEPLNHKITRLLNKGYKTDK